MIHMQMAEAQVMESSCCDAFGRPNMSCPLCRPIKPHWHSIGDESIVKKKLMWYFLHCKAAG